MQNEKALSFLETVVTELERHFGGLDVAKKLEKRRGELLELRSICQDFDDKLGDMREHLEDDL
jgi:hypothetical protein